MSTKFLFLIICLSLFSCSNRDTTPKEIQQAKTYIEVTPTFQELLDAKGLDGSILIFDPEKRTYYSNDFQWGRKGQLPASTFKIPNSIVALESGVILNEDVILPWDGRTRSIANWNQDLVFSDAFKFSCVPCYQQIARDVGFNRMRKYLDMFSYPEGVQFDTSNIDMFWLVGKARINQFEQIEFLKRLYEGDLPISNKTYTTMRKIMVVDTTGQYILSGKTGWSISNDINNGWFVGFAEVDKKVLYFATNVEPNKDTPIADFISGRREVTEAAIGVLK